jgi:hypothetical protein
MVPVPFKCLGLCAVGGSGGKGRRDHGAVVVEPQDGFGHGTVPRLAAGATQRDSPVTWRIRASEDDKYELEVRSNTRAKQKRPITIRTRGVFD